MAVRLAAVEREAGMVSAPVPVPAPLPMAVAPGPGRPARAGIGSRRVEAVAESRLLPGEAPHAQMEASMLQPQRGSVVGQERGRAVAPVAHSAGGSSRRVGPSPTPPARSK